MNDFLVLREELKKNNIDVSDFQINQFKIFYELLIEWNEKINLTSITDFEGVIFKHFIDSILLMKYVDISNLSVIDIGTGAGFPGIPLAIMNPNAKLSLLDSLNKRINFINIVLKECNINNVNTYHGRAEDFAFNKLFREKFDIATSRAVANLSTLSEYCLPFVKVGGKFIPYKSEHCNDEVNQAKKAISILGGTINAINEYSLNFEDINNKLVIINKVKSTNNKYPRKAGTPSKSPLGME